MGLNPALGRYVFALLLLSVHPSVDRVFSNYCEMYMCRPKKIVQVLKQSMYRLKHNSWGALQMLKGSRCLKGTKLKGETAHSGSWL